MALIETPRHNRTLAENFERLYSHGVRCSPTPMFYAVSPREYHNHCWYCGIRLVMHLRGTNLGCARTVDHVVPRSLKTESRKKVPACRDCNLRKMNLSVSDYRIVFFGLHGSIVDKFFGEKREAELRSERSKNNLLA